MKSERRHQLEKNELADRLASGIESSQSVLPFIVGGVVVLAIVAVGWGLYSSNSKKKASVAWTEFYFNLTRGDADSFVDLASDFPQSPATGWSLQIAGDDYLQRGVMALYTNRTEGEELLKQAIEAYEKVDQSTQNPELRTKSLLGLAEAHESLGDIEQAANLYQQVAKSATQPGIINEANERLAFLTSDAGKKFYDWFGTLDPKPDAPITLPSDLTLPPMTPDLQFGPVDGALPSIPAPSTPSPTTGANDIVLPDLPAATPVAPPTDDTGGENGGDENTGELQLDLPAAGDVPPAAARPVSNPGEK